MRRGLFGVGDLGDLSWKKGEEWKDGEELYKISSQPAPQPQWICGALFWFTLVHLGSLCFTLLQFASFCLLHLQSDILDVSRRSDLQPIHMTCVEKASFAHRKREQQFKGNFGRRNAACALYILWAGVSCEGSSIWLGTVSVFRLI